jgi:hypothetical protein
MLREHRLVDIADRSKLYVLGVLVERQQVVLGNPPATDKADTELAVTDDREVLHEIHALDA